jgi:hypothetical protein
MAVITYVSIGNSLVAIALVLGMFVLNLVMPSKKQAYVKVIHPIIMAQSAIQVGFIVYAFLFL